MVYRFCRLICKILGIVLFHLKTSGTDSLGKAKGAVVAANHSSYLDPVLVGIASPYKIYYLARNTLFRNRYFSALLYAINVIPIDRNRLDKATFKIIIKSLKSGRKIVMFPEGTRSRNGELQPGRNGVGLIALSAKVPIIPVYVKNSFKILPRHRNTPRLAKVTVSFGEPIYLDKWLNKQHIDKSDYQEVSDMVMEKILQLKQKT